MSNRPQAWHEMTRYAQGFIAVVTAAGACVVIWGALHWSSRDPLKFLCYTAVALLASRLKVHLPGITGTMSVNFLFILLGIVELSLPETLVLGCAAILTQCFHRDRPQLVQVIFNVCGSAWAIAAAYQVYHISPLHAQEANRSLQLIAAATTYFLSNTIPVAAVISLTEHKSLIKIYSQCYFWSFPYYLLAAGIAALIHYLGHSFDWRTSLLILPAVYVIHRSYSLYLGKLENEKRHVEEMANLHLRTIEALALAIEAKDQTTHDHLQRVRVYAIEVAKELKLGRDEIEALQAAALLHDIGKLAVPEHIISKPGRLTTEEFEKMKIHPVVGAEILERVRFPYPVVPIVRAHHEKWDGSGYPLGLKGEEIPIGARILSAVDFLDALSSDRQYRRAMPLPEVMRRLEAESGKAFDPKIVAILERRYSDMERLVQARNQQQIAWSKLSTDMKVERGPAPATGFAYNAAPTTEASFLSSIAAARQEAQALFELSQDLGASLSVGETLSVFSVKLKRLVPYDSIAIYIRRDDELVPEHVNGDNFRLFASLRIPIGEGLSGWVAQNRKPIINGNPQVEPGYTTTDRYTAMRSALSVPLEGLDGIVGVLTLYKAEKDAFTADHLRILLAVSSKMALAIENALKYQQAESSSTTDYLTGLPNARSLFLQLDRELSRCKRTQSRLTVMVCDMDGFKQVNDRFGHLEGNRVLKLFAQSLKESCRDYDYVARMGGDEFVLIAPGLNPEAARSKMLVLREMARKAGFEVCREDILSLSVGQAIYPENGLDAEQLLAEADRRMYQEKQQQPGRKNRRGHPRMICRLTVTLQPFGTNVPILGNLSDISLTGCYVETAAILACQTQVRIFFSIDDDTLQSEGVVVRSIPGAGIAIQFLEAEDRSRVHRILEHVQNATKFYDRQLGYRRMAVIPD
ncbi:MAG: diguanylate cyclase [Acidobacteria bacterium]|nr:diguanylate cyclase [Acidobacteriota bacterium]MBV9484169.1 diguanylate cyclase [Acidobacteriota bacterium]